ncbi:MAG: sugar phosphate nucleotidyltransferase [Chloroflexota bacterium]
MKVIIPLAGFGTRMRPHTWSRPKALMHVAGNTVLGHILEQIEAITTDEVIFIVGYKGAEIEAWVNEHYAHLNAHFVIQEEPLGQAHALWLCRDFLDESPVFMTFGDGIIDAEYEQLHAQAVDGIAFVEEVEDPRSFGVAVLGEDGAVKQIIEKPETLAHKLAVVGAYWFKNGRSLKSALDRMIAEEIKTKGEYYLADALGLLLQDGFKMHTMATKFWFDAGTPTNILETNKRLLGLGYGSEDAIDRSYGEDFTVIPPVFIHETAVIDGCVLGPYVSIGPEAHLERVIVKHSIIDANSKLTDMNLTESLIGEKSEVAGSSQTLFVGDNSKMKFN